MAFYGVQGFSYDALGRLESAVYGENEGLITNPNRYNETVLEYTENGAIKRFQRRGLKQNNVYGKIDNLNISLDGNRVVHVDDDALPVARKGLVDFTDSGERQTEYTYNADGALTGDANRGMAKIDYDACGYPRRVQFMDGSVTEYVYTVTGVKLRTVHRTAVPGISVAFGQTRELTEGETLSADSTDYLGNLILEDGEPSKYLFEGGYCSFDGDGISYHYYDRDHQGNIRAVVNSDGTVEQIMNYYPFGTPFSDGTALNPDLQPYKYNGKEFESMHGRNAYDYGARFYDPLLPTWDRMDPLCEKYYHVSPYAYCANDPVNRIDVDGNDWISAKYDDEWFVYYDSRISSREDINKFYYKGGQSTNINYLGKSGRIMQETSSGWKTFMTLNEDGFMYDTDGNKFNSEYNVEGLLNVGSDKMAIKDPQYSHNWYGTYLGPNNPQKEIGKNIKYIYSIPPIDELDYVAYKHDKAYDNHSASGKYAAFFNTDVISADMVLYYECFKDMHDSKAFSREWWWSLGAGVAFSVISTYKHLLPW